MSEFINYGTIPEDNQLPMGVDEHPVGLETGTPAPVGAQTQVIASAPADDYGYLTNPYENLSKTQRRMLAFAAIKDAGMSLQGKQGNSFQTMVSDITARADMARKAKAAQASAERDRLMQAQVMAMLGGAPAAASTGVGAVIMPTTDGDLQAQIDQLNAAIPVVSMQSPDMANSLLFQRDTLQAELDEKEADEALRAETESVRAASINNLQGLTDTAEKAFVASLGEDFEAKLDDIISGEETGRRWISSGWGLVPDSRLEFSRFIAAVDKIKSTLTFDNMADMKKRGITFGSLSDSELRQVSDTVGKLDAHGNPRLAVQELAVIYRKLSGELDDLKLQSLMGDM